MSSIECLFKALQMLNDNCLNHVKLQIICEVKDQQNPFTKPTWYSLYCALLTHTDIWKL